MCLGRGASLRLGSRWQGGIQPSQGALRRMGRPLVLPSPAVPDRCEGKLWKEKYPTNKGGQEEVERGTFPELARVSQRNKNQEKAR
jgi:hypothetical protein